MARNQQRNSSDGSSDGPQKDLLADRRDESGGLKDPPIITSYEQQLQEAHAAADQDRIDVLTDEYHGEREKLAQQLAERSEKRRQERRRELLEAREREEANA